LGVVLPFKREQRGGAVTVLPTLMIGAFLVVFLGWFLWAVLGVR
jgi:hypothetical protein